MSDRPKILSLAEVVATAPGIARNGHGPMPPRDEVEIEPSSYLRLLPAIYSADEFVGRFLHIFEDVLDPVSVMVDNMPYYFDPLTAPPEMLDWLAMWVNLKEGADWPTPRRRALIAAAPAIYRMRGTRAGLKQHVGIYSGGLPLIMERTNGFRLDPDARLGVNTSIGDVRPGIMSVTIGVPRPRDLDVDTLRAIIEADKPAEVGYTLRVVKLAFATESARKKRS